MNNTQPDMRELPEHARNIFTSSFRTLAAGVSIMTSVDLNGNPVGFTATSLASLSAEPPLASFNMSRGASSWAAIEQSEWVILHILGENNLALAQKMAAEQSQRFVGEHWEPGPKSVPLLKDVPAWMLGKIIARYPVADSAVVVAQIVDGGGQGLAGGLLYHERKYFGLGDALS